MPFLNQEQFLQEGKVLDVNDFLRADPSNILGLDEFLSATSGLEAKRRKDLDDDESPFMDAVNILDKTFSSFLQEASFGLIKNTSVPEGVGEQIGSGIGSFAGMLVGPYKGAKLLTRPLAKAPKALAGIIRGGMSAHERTKFGMMTAKLLRRTGAYAINQVGTMAAAEVLRDVTDMEGAPERAAQGALIGGIFGAAGLMGVTKSPVLNQILRQFGGRALLTVGGQYPNGLPDAEMVKDAPALANFIFSEAMNTFFLSHGITPQKLLTGNLTAKEKARVEFIEEERKRVNEKIALSIPQEAFEKPYRTKVSISELWLDKAAATKENEPNVIKRSSVVDTREINVEWDIDKKQYVPMNESDQLAATIAENHIRQIKGEKTSDLVSVRIWKPKPNYVPQLQSVAKIFQDIVGHKDVVSETIRKIKGMIYYAADIRTISKDHPTEGLRMLDIKSISEAKLEPWEVLVQASGSSKEGISVVHSFSQIAAGTEARKYIVNKGSRLPTVEQKAAMADISEKIKILEDGIKAAGENPAPEAVVDLAAKKADLVVLSAQLGLTSTEAAAPQKFEIKRELNAKDLEYRGKLVARKAKLEAEISPGGSDPIFDPDVSGNSRTLRLQKTLDAVNAKLAYVDKELTKQTIDISEVMKTADLKLTRIRNAPLQRIPKSAVDSLEKELIGMNLGFTPGQNHKILLDCVARSGSKSKGILRLEHLPDIEYTMNQLRALPKYKRWDALMHSFRWDHGLLKKELTGKQLARQEEYNKSFYRDRQAAWIEAEKMSKKSGGSVMQHLFELSAGKNLWDFRFFAMKVEKITPIPLYAIWRNLRPAVRARKKFVTEMTQHLKGFERADKNDQRAVKQYYDAMYDGKDKRYADSMLKTKFQQDYRTAIDTMMEKAAPLVIESRYKIWLRNVYLPRLDGYDTGHVALRRQGEPEINAFLERGYEPYLNMKKFMAKEGGNIKDWAAWIAEAKERSLFTVQDGGYLPTGILSDKQIKLGRVEPAMGLGAFGEGHITSRAKNAKLGESDMLIADTFADMFKNQNLNLQLQNYANQIGNLFFVEPKMKALEDAVNIFRKDLEKAKPSGFTKTGAESKGLSLIDMFNIYGARVKGFPVKLDPFQMQLRGAQTVFFKSLAVRPLLWLRNMYQVVHTMPHKSFILDPRFIFGRGYTTKKLPKEAKEWMELNALEGDDFVQYYLNESVQLGLANTPGVKQLWGLAEKVGRIYAATDTWNRKAVFTKTWWRSKHYVDAFLRGEVSQDKMENRLGINKMNSQEQEPFRTAIESKDAISAANEIATFQTVNSQWAYSREQRSVAEMTAGGETYSNLLTWTKSMGQWIINAGKRIDEGYERSKDAKGHIYDLHSEKGRAYKQMLDAGVQIGGLAMAGILGNELYERATNSAGAQFKSFGFGMFGWNFGGVSQSIINDISAAFADGMTALDGPESARDKWAENFNKNIVDRLALRQMVPFMRQAFAVYESVSGRSYFSPAFEAYTKFRTGNPKMATVVNRTIAEGIIHGIFTQDPNKSRETREFTYGKMLEMEKGAREEKDPLLRAYYKLQAPRFRYLNDVFHRYEPIEVYSVWEDKQKRARLKDYTYDWARRDYNDYHNEIKRQQEEMAGYGYGGSRVKYF